MTLLTTTSRMFEVDREELSLKDCIGLKDDAETEANSRGFVSSIIKRAEYEMKSIEKPTI